MSDPRPALQPQRGDHPAIDNPRCIYDKSRAYLDRVDTMKLKSGLASVAACAIWVTPCLAHHSAAIFDSTKSVTLVGTVKGFEWTNPHCWIQILAPVEGTTTEWSVEMGSPSQLYRKGWRPGTLKPGDKVTIVINPARDGSNGGSFVSGIDASGKPFETATAVHP
jgi:hypothetical protein